MLALPREREEEGEREREERDKTTLEDSKVFSAARFSMGARSKRPTGKYMHTAKNYVVYRNLETCSRTNGSHTGDEGISEHIGVERYSELAEQSVSRKLFALT